MKQKIIHSPEAQRLDFLDSRFYTLNGEQFYPSVTHVLDVYPKGYAFYEWLKSVGNNQDQILQKASDEGTKIHNAIEKCYMD
jgi:ribulose-5-phosphate 4-epimerase/fuculose-1-phosphate aldolase